MTKAYDKIDKATELGWLHMNPSTFVGSVEHPTHLLIEVLDNAVDEAMAGYADKIQIIIKNDICKITDNGRGMPVGNDKDTGLPFPVLVCTKMFTSGKFDTENNAYENESGGLNGVGLTAVAGLSDYLLLRSYRNGKQYDYKFVTDFDKHKVNYALSEPVKADGKGTAVMFHPSKRIYESLKYDISYIKDKIKLLRMLTDVSIDFKVDDEVIDIPVNKERILDNYFDDAEDNECYKASFTSDSENLSVFFYYDYSKTDTKFKGCVNMLPVHQGNHIEFVKDIIKDCLNSLFPKSAKLDSADLLCGLRCFVYSRLKNAKFSGQTKGKLALKMERFGKFKNSITKAIKTIIKDNIGTQSLLDRLISVKASKEVKTVTKTVKRRKFTPNLFDCLKGGKDSILFIVEGESAAGSLIKCRDKNYHAVYTLTGKSIPNVTTASVNKILANKTVADLFNVLGKDLNLAELTDTSKVKYGRICITTDPDVDGYHISIMALLFLNRFFPKLIEEGRVMLSQIPLYGYYDKKKFIPVYDMDEARSMLDSGKKLMRHKGLGEFDPDELEVILFKESRYIVVNKGDVKDIVINDDEEE